MILGIVKEASPRETRVALVPSVLKPLFKAGFEVLVEPGAGRAAGDAQADGLAISLAQAVARAEHA